MGASHSTAAALNAAGPLLTRLAGAEPIPHAAPFWDQLFSLPTPLAALDPADVELTLAPHCRQLRECLLDGLHGSCSACSCQLRTGRRRHAAMDKNVRIHLALGKGVGSYCSRGGLSLSSCGGWQHLPSTPCCQTPACSAPSLPLSDLGTSKKAAPPPTSHFHLTMPTISARRHPTGSRQQPADPQLPVAAAAPHGAHRGRTGRRTFAARRQCAAPGQRDAEDHGGDGGAQHSVLSV